MGIEAVSTECFAQNPFCFFQKEQNHWGLKQDEQFYTTKIRNTLQHIKGNNEREIYRDVSSYCRCIILGFHTSQ